MQSLGLLLKIPRATSEDDRMFTAGYSKISAIDSRKQVWGLMLDQAPFSSEEQLENRLQAVLNFTRPPVLRHLSERRVTCVGCIERYRIDWPTETCTRGIVDAVHIRCARAGRCASAHAVREGRIYVRRILIVAKELRFVEQVEELHAELHVEPLGELEVLVEREIGVGDSRRRALAYRGVGSASSPKRTYLISNHRPSIRIQPLELGRTRRSTTRLARYHQGTNVVLIGTCSTYTAWSSIDGAGVEYR